MNVTVRLLTLVLVALMLGACGESEEDKAQTAVCNARDDMAKQVDQLKSLTPSTITTDGVSKSLTAIKNDLSDIAGAQADLSDERRQQVQAANKEFASQVQKIVGDLGRSLSAADAKTQLTGAVQQLADAYQQTFAQVDCD